jgi:hypothetical protein
MYKQYGLEFRNSRFGKNLELKYEDIPGNQENIARKTHQSGRQLHN